MEILVTKIKTQIWRGYDENDIAVVTIITSIGRIIEGEEIVYTHGDFGFEKYWQRTELLKSWK